MTLPTQQQMSRDALTELRDADDARFWELAAAYGFVRPERIHPDQSGFWTREWVGGEIEVEIAKAEGRGTFYASAEEFLASLDEDDQEAPLANADVREA